MKILSQNILIGVWLFLLPQFLLGQETPNVQIDWGQELKEPNRSTLSKIITTNETGIYALREERTNKTFDGPPNIYIEHYTPQMKLRRSTKIEMKQNKKRVELETVLLLGGKLYLFTSFNNRAKQINYLFAQEVNYKRLEPSRKLVKVAENPTKNVAKEGYFDFRISKDSSKLLIFNKNPESRKANEAFSVYVYDQELNPIWEKEIILPYPSQQTELESYEVDNAGNVYLMGTVFDKGVKERRKGKPNYRYTVLAYTDNGETVEEFPVSLENQFITDLTFKIANNGHLVCAGFYSEKGTASARGTYFFRLNPADKNISADHTKEFDFNLRTATLSDRKRAKALAAEESGKTKNQAELKSYSLDHLILRNDGGAVLVAEQYFVQAINNNNYNPYGRIRSNNTTEYYYNYNDIIVANIRPDGEIEWATLIPKQQETLNDQGYFSSYTMATVRDKLFFVFNDHHRNFEPNNDKFYNFDGRRNAVITIAQIGKNGELDVYPVIGNGQSNVMMRPKVSRQTGRREMILFGENGRKFKLGTLQFL